MVIDLFLTVVGLAGLFIGGEMFVQAASRLARSLGISTLVVGLTIVAIGTSMPELIVSVGAALRGSSDVALGNVIGSNVANIGLIIGLSAVLAPFIVQVRMVRREIPLLIGITLFAYVLLFDGTLSRLDGLLLMVGGAAYLIWMLVSAREVETGDDPKDSEVVDIKRGAEALRLMVGLVLLLIGANLTVEGALTLARAIGISELVIGITVVAIGTSLPELVTSITAARRKESDIALGNVVGSNIANLLIILGITSFIQPIAVPTSVINFDALIMIGFTLVLVPFVFNRRIGRIEGALFVTAYFSYSAFLLLV